MVGTYLERRLKVVIASRDKDFKQLISEDVQLAIPMENVGRWSFYTMKHYLAQYECNPGCIIGDEADGVPGIQAFVPAFGRNTALKLLKKHGYLENLLKTAAVRTVGKPYAQDALIKYADHLPKNYQAPSLKRDIDVHLQDEWLLERETCNDSYAAVSNLYGMLGGRENPTDRWTYQR
ncbi:5'-3' exonuclease-like protein [Drosera capensis]